MSKYVGYHIVPNHELFSLLLSVDEPYNPDMGFDVPGFSEDFLCPLDTSEM